MYTLTRAQWNEIEIKHPDYAGRTLMPHTFNGILCDAGDRMCFAHLLPGYPSGSNGLRLVFEHIHFEIVG